MACSSIDYYVIIEIGGASGTDGAPKPVCTSRSPLSPVRPNGPVGHAGSNASCCCSNEQVSWYARRVDAPSTREEFLAAPLSELAAYWLELRCDPARCTKASIVPLRMLAVQRGDQLLLQTVIARLGCSSCGARPTLACITDSQIKVAPHDAARGAQWSVRLLP